MARGYTQASQTYIACILNCHVLAQEAVDGIVALNHATGLQALHYEECRLGSGYQG